MGVGISSLALTGTTHNVGAITLTITVGADSGNPCIIKTCTINGHCSSTLQSCFTNEYITGNCYSHATGGSLSITISKPSYNPSQYQPCSSSTPGTLFVALFNITSNSIALNPTPSPSYNLPSNLVEVQGAPFYALAAVVVGCIMYGVVLIRLRDTSDSLVSVTLTKMCGSLGLFGSSLTSELAYIAALFVNNTSNLKWLAVVVLVARLFHLPVGCYIIRKLMGSSSTNRYSDVADKEHSDTSIYTPLFMVGSSRTNSYLQLIDKEHLLVNRSIYIPLLLMILLDNTNVAFLPWISTEFSGLSDGYPDLRLYTMCVFAKILQSFIVVVIQTVVLIELQGHGFRSLSLDTQVFLCISIVSSIISFIITAMAVVLQASLLKSLTDSNNNDDDRKPNTIMSINTSHRGNRSHNNTFHNPNPNPHCIR